MKLTCVSIIDPLLLSWAIATLPTLPLSAQIVPDATLPEPSRVESGCAVCTIDGGVLRGTNLFHSFEEFSIPTGGEALFNNGLAIENIFSRVTGDSISNIDGLIRANGTANLFLLNPNGILFGPNAQLDIGGSFLGSTADAVGFGDRQFYSASNPEAPPLLTVNPSALFFDRASTGAIEVRSVLPAGMESLEVPFKGLRVPDDRSLVLVGGEIFIDGGGLNASGGRVELTGVAGLGTVEIDVDLNQLDVSIVDGLARSNISLSGEAAIGVTGESGGDVEISGKRVSIAGDSLISANTQGVGTGGILSISATESLELLEGSLLESSAATLSSGNAGDISIVAPIVRVRGGAQISVTISGTGTGGNLTVNATESIELLGTDAAIENSSGLFAQTRGSGQAGNLTIRTRNLTISDAAQISVSTFDSGNGGVLEIAASESVELAGTSVNGRFPSGIFASARSTGRAGNLSITTNRLLVRDGGLISAGTFAQGDGGNLTINASESVIVTDSRMNPLFPNGIFTRAEETGNAGELTISTQNLFVSGGSRVSSGTNGSGGGGRLSINASESVEITGTTFDGRRRSGVFTASQATGRAGDLEIETPTLRIRNRGTISATTIDGLAGRIALAVQTLETSGGGRIQTTSLGDSNAGDITLSASQIRLMGSDSGLFANTEPESSGNGGSIEVNSATVTIEDRATIAVDSQGTGIGGTIDLTADSLSLENEASILAETVSTDGGNVEVRVSNLLFLSDESRISTTAGTAPAGGNGGDISIATPDGFIVARQDSDITANAFEGRGGNIDITAQSLFGIQPRNRLTDRSDITATSALNTDGEINIDTPDIDPTQGLASLPTAPGVPETARGCDTGDGTGRFIDRGRGGLPTVPMEPLESNDILEDIQPPQGWENRESGRVDRSDRLVEATGWTVDDNGRVVLVADNQVVIPDGCRG